MIPRRALGLAACAVALLVGCGSLAPPAATVDGVAITDARVATDVRLFQALSALARQGCATPTGTESAEAACSREVLNSLVQQQVVSRYARAHHVEVAVADVTKESGSLLSQLGGAAAVDPALRARDLTRQDVRNLARRIVLFSNVRDAVTAARVTNAELQQTYRQNLAQYRTLHAEHILVKTRAEAERVYRIVTASGSTEADFLAEAKKVSTDPSVSQNGGDLGDVPASSLDATFVQAALALRPGEISKPVHTSFGWHVIRLVSAGYEPFDQVRPQLEQQVSQDAFRSWITEELTSADVAVNPRYGRWDPSIPGIVPVTSTATSEPTATASAPPSTAASP